MGYLSSVIGHPTDGSPVSGGGLSQNGKFSYGYASSPGKRASMEDFYETRIDSVDGQIVGLFGVFDGHGGAKVAEYVKQNLFNHLLRHPKFISDTKVAIDDSYKSTDTEFLESDSSQSQCGSTASTAVLVGNRLFVANVGDSRAIISRGGNVLAWRGYCTTVVSSKCVQYLKLPILSEQSCNFSCESITRPHIHLFLHSFWFLGCTASTTYLRML